MRWTGIGFTFKSMVAWMMTVTLSPNAFAHEVTYPDEREIELLAANVDKTIQACGLHAAAFNRTGGRILTERGISLSDDAPDPIRELASPSTFGKSRYHQWLDPHAKIWLIASSEKPSCRVAISDSQWVDRIGTKLDELVRAGNFWRPVDNGQIPKAANGVVYIMDTPASVPIRPTLLVMTAGAGAPLPSAQQMIITVLMVDKR